MDVRGAALGTGDRRHGAHGDDEHEQSSHHEDTPVLAAVDEQPGCHADMRENPRESQPSPSEMADLEDS